MKSFLIEEKIYSNNRLIEDKNELIRRMGFGCGIVEEIWITFTKNISDNDLKKPIIEYLLNNNIDRACWNINIYNTFFDSVTEIIGYMNYTCVSHHTNANCDAKYCDLITGISFSGSRTFLKDRYKTYKFTFLMSRNNQHIINLTLPLICMKRTILEEFLKNTNITSDNKFKIIDLDVYCIKKEHSYNKVCQIERILNDDLFVIEYCCENNRDIYWTHMDTICKYVITYKPILSSSLQKLVQLPENLSDIIYTYSDFELLSTSDHSLFDNLVKL